MTLSRREFLAGAAGVFAFEIGGATEYVTPAQARARGARYRVLDETKVRAIESLGDALLPGAAAAGLAQYVDSQLDAAAEQSLLMLRYLDVPPPYAPFYQSCLAGVDAAAMAAHEVPFAGLNGLDKDLMVAAMQKGSPPGWLGPPAPLFYFVLRSDAVDVVYGTPAGFEKLKLPYMPHIMPPSDW